MPRFQYYCHNRFYFMWLFTGVWCMGGRLLKILPNNPNDGQSAVVEIFNCQGIMNVDELKAFPGPLVKWAIPLFSVFIFT